jgi:hypothetical protein
MLLCLTGLVVGGYFKFIRLPMLRVQHVYARPTRRHAAAGRLGVKIYETESSCSMVMAMSSTECNILDSASKGSAVASADNQI